MQKVVGSIPIGSTIGGVVWAAGGGLDVVLPHSAIESMDIGRRFRSIYLAGPTFNLMADENTPRGHSNRSGFIYTRGAQP